MKDFVMWNARSLEVLRGVEFYYVHKDTERLKLALDAVVDLNGTANQPLIAFMIAAIAILEYQKEELQWIGASLEARVQRTLNSRDPNDAKDALARVEQASLGPFGNSLSTLVKWARSSLAPKEALA